MDADLRAVERAIAEGDEKAHERLVHAKLRVGICGDCLASPRYGEFPSCRPCLSRKDTRFEAVLIARPSSWQAKNHLVSKVGHQTVCGRTIHGARRRKKNWYYVGDWMFEGRQGRLYEVTCSGCRKKIDGKAELKDLTFPERS